MNIILMGAIIAILGGVVSAIGTWLQNKQSSEKSTRIESGVNKTNEEVNNLKQQNDSLKANLETQLNKIDELRRENTNLYEKLSKSSREIYNNITGGDGNKPVLHLGITPIVKSKEKGVPDYFIVMFTVENIGKYPLKNATIKISDTGSRDLIPYRIGQWVNGTTTRSGILDKDKEYENYQFVKDFQLGSISPKVKKHFYRAVYSQKTTPLLPFYSVEISWDNGNLLHFIHLKIEEEKLMFDRWETLFNGKETTDTNLIKFD